METFHPHIPFTTVAFFLHASLLYVLHAPFPAFSVKQDVTEDVWGATEDGSVKVFRSLAIFIYQRGATHAQL